MKDKFYIMHQGSVLFGVCLDINRNVLTIGGTSKQKGKMRELLGLMEIEIPNPVWRTHSKVVYTIIDCEHSKGSVVGMLKDFCLGNSYVLYTGIKSFGRLMR